MIACNIHQAIQPRNSFASLLTMKFKSVRPVHQLVKHMYYAQLLGAWWYSSNPRHSGLCT